MSWSIFKASSFLPTLLVWILVGITQSHVLRYQLRQDHHVEQDSQKWLEKNLPAVGELFEGDIEMDSRLRRTVLGYTDKRSAIIGQSYRWPDGVVPFEFDRSIGRKAKKRIYEAILEFQKRTCVKFVKRLGEDDYVVFRSIPRRCSSPVGRQGGVQHITIGKGCTRLGTVLHEMMHSIGIIHEQSRPDRDDFVEVFYKNVKKDYVHNFQKYPRFEVTNLDTPYNYASIMHYRNTAFSKNGEDTLEAKRDRNLIFGQRIMFSEGDVREINRLYPCSKRSTDVYDGLIEDIM